MPPFAKDYVWMIDLSSGERPDTVYAGDITYIEMFYNRQRRHSSIGYQAPLPYDAAYSQAA
jgi:hypothetical protein